MARKLKQLVLLVAMVTMAAACTEDAKPADKKPTVDAPDKKADDKKAGDKKADAKKDGKKADAKKMAEKPAQTGPIAKVNGVEIKREDYNQSVEELKKRFSMFGGNIPEAQLARFKQKIVERMVEDELINQELTKANVTITDAEIGKELDEYKKRTPGGPDQFDAFLKRSGMTVDKIKTDIKQRLSLQKHLNKDGSMNIPDAEVKKYYEDNKKRYEVKERVKASHILIKVDKKADDAKKKEAKAKIDGIYKEASKKGADFATMAKAKSEGTSAPRGGDLGFFGKGRMVKEFEAVAFKMKPGQVSKPVQTQFGWHVIKVTDHQDAGQRKFDEVKDEINQRLQSRKFRTAREKFVKGLRTAGKVEVLEKIEIPPPAPASAPGGNLPPGVKINKGGIAPGGKQPIKIDPKQLQKKMEEMKKKGKVPTGKIPTPKPK